MLNDIAARCRNGVTVENTKSKQWAVTEDDLSIMDSRKKLRLNEIMMSIKGRNTLSWRGNKGDLWLKNGWMQEIVEIWKMKVRFSGL